MIDRRDLIAGLGVLALLEGAREIYSPAAWLVAGVLLLAAWALPYWRKG